MGFFLSLNNKETSNKLQACIAAFKTGKTDHRDEHLQGAKQ